MCGCVCVKVCVCVCWFCPLKVACHWTVNCAQATAAAGSRLWGGERGAAEWRLAKVGHGCRCEVLISSSTTGGHSPVWSRRPCRGTTHSQQKQHGKTSRVFWTARYLLMQKYRHGEVFWVCLRGCRERQKGEVSTLEARLLRYLICRQRSERESRTVGERREREAKGIRLQVLLKMSMWQILKYLYWIYMKPSERNRHQHQQHQQQRQWHQRQRALEFN